MACRGAQNQPRNPFKRPGEEGIRSLHRGLQYRYVCHSQLITKPISSLLLASATLPHEKFYDMAKYERRMDALRQGEFLPPADDTYDPDADMRALAGAHKKKAAEREVYMSREQLEELRRVQNERNQVSN